MNQEGTINEAQIDSLFKVGAHFGFSKSRRHPSMKPYIFGIKNKVEIFDLEKASELLESTKEFMRECGQSRKTILFVAGKNEARGIVEEVATSIDMPYVAGRWIGGSLTNFSEIKKRLSRLGDLTEKKEKGELGQFTKLERLHIDREITDLENTFGGLRHMDKLPDVLFAVDTKQEEIAVLEAKRLKIPVAGLMNSDCNTRDADHFVIGNDSSVASITFFLNELVDAYKEGLSRAPEKTTNEDKSKEGQPKNTSIKRSTTK